MSDVFCQNGRPLQPSYFYYLPSNGYPSNHSFYHSHFQHPPPYSQQSFPPPFLPDQPYPQHVSYTFVSPTHPSTLRRRLSRQSSLRVQRQLSSLHSRATTLKKHRRTAQPPAFPISGALSSIQLARGRPHDWRSGYKPPSKSYFRRRFESLVVHSKIDTRSCVLTPPLRLNFLLEATQDDFPNIFCDLRNAPIKSAIFLPYLNRLTNTIDFCQLITSPPIHHMTLWHRKLPWQFNIEASQPNGITIYDFFRHLHQQLHQPIVQEEYYTDELAPGDREELIMAFQTRRAMFPDQLPVGVRRIDFLGQEVCFIGLKHRRGGKWEIKTELPPPKERMTID